MRVRGHLISCGIGLIAGALLVGGLALQPERGPGNPNRPRDRQQPDQRPGDRPGDRPGPDGPPDGPRDGPPGGRPPIDRERAVRRLEERLKSLDKQKELVTSVLERLRKGDTPERLGGELLEAMRGPGAPGGGNPPQGGNDREEMRRIVGEFSPELVNRMDDFAKRYPVGARVLGNLMPKPQEILRAKQEDQIQFDLYKVQIAGGLDVGEIAMSLHDLVRAGKEDSDEAKAKKASLRDALTTQFETRRKVQERDIESLTKRIDELKERVNETAEQRAAAVDAHLERLTRLLREMKPRDR